MERLIDILNDQLENCDITLDGVKNALFTHGVFDHLPTMREALDTLCPYGYVVYNVMCDELAKIGLHAGREMDGTIFFFDSADTAVAPDEESLEYLSEFYEDSRLANDEERAILCSDDLESLFEYLC